MTVQREVSNQTPYSQPACAQTQQLHMNDGSTNTILLRAERLPTTPRYQTSAL
jgi:hypothetical protein